MQAESWPTPHLPWCWPHPATPFTHQDETSGSRQASSANTDSCLLPTWSKGRNHCTFHYPTCLQVGPAGTYGMQVCVRAEVPQVLVPLPPTCLEGQCAGGHSEEGAAQARYQSLQIWMVWAWLSGQAARTARILAGQVQPAAGTQVGVSP